MSWLEQAFGLEPEPTAAPEPYAPPQIVTFVCTVRQPSGADGDYGTVVDCRYFIERGVLHLCDANGKEIAGRSQKLEPGERPRVVASRIRKAQWEQEDGKSAFWAPLHYGPAAVF